MSQHEKNYIPGIILLVFIFIAYLPALNISLRGDDFEWLNESYTGWYHPSDLFTRINNFFRPVVKLSYLLNYKCFTTNSFFYNITTIGIHLVNVFLLYLFLLHIVGRRAIAFISALMFGISSLYAEVTLWTAGRPDSILLMFMLGLLLFTTAIKSPSTYSHSMIACLTLGAIGSKESWVLLPFIMLSYLLLVKRLSLKASLKMTAMQWLMLGGYLIIFLGVPFFSQRSLPTSYANAPISESMFKFCHQILRYCELGQFYSGSFLQSILVITGVLGIIIWIMKTKNHLALWGILWMLMTLSISLPISYAPSRYNYLPLVGFWIAVIAIFDDIYIRVSQNIRLSSTLKFSALILVLSLYIINHVAMLQYEIQDYEQYGEFHQAVIKAYEVIAQEESAEEQPILFLNNGTLRPLRHLIKTTQGYSKLFFVRTTAIWELVSFDALANFAGQPFTRLLVPVRENILPVLERNVHVVIFTDAGFEVTQSTRNMREELQGLYKTHGRLPDNVAIYRSISVK